MCQFSYSSTNRIEYWDWCAVWVCVCVSEWCARVDHWTISNKMGTEPFILRCSKQSCVNRHWFMFSTKLSIRSGNLLAQSDQCRFKSSRFNFAIQWFYTYIFSKIHMVVCKHLSNQFSFISSSPSVSLSNVESNLKYTYRIHVAWNAQPKWM